ncbi:MAG: metallophosphoesterase, partial [Firmicutes bacterium]|nr:metallophosphoesterase [Bacillota bacterium]
MRIGIISDIHGNYAALEAVLRDLDRAKPDRVINLGDQIFKGPQ